MLKLHGCFTVGIGNQGKGILNNLLFYVQFAENVCKSPALSGNTQTHLVRGRASETISFSYLFVPCVKNKSGFRRKETLFKRLFENAGGEEIMLQGERVCCIRENSDKRTVSTQRLDRKGLFFHKEESTRLETICVGKWDAGTEQRMITLRSACYGRGFLGEVVCCLRLRWVKVQGLGGRRET